MVFYHGTELRILGGIKEGGGLKPSTVTGSRQGGRLQVHLTTDEGSRPVSRRIEVTRAPESKQSWFYVEGTVPAKVLYIVDG